MAELPGHEGRDLGFTGLLAAGLTPVQAWQKIRRETTPEALAIITDLEGDPDGRATLAWLAERWKAHGMRPPWEGLVLTEGGEVADAEAQRRD